VAKIAAARRTEPVKLTKLLRDELDWVVMKCLEKDRARRYQSATDLGRDVERHLADEPVEACPPSAGYKLRKFARKNKKLLATVASFVIVLIAGTAFSAWQAHRAGQAEMVARQSEAEALAERNAAAAARDAEAAARANADTQRLQAESNFKKAREAVDEYFTKISQSKLLNVPGLQPLRKELLESTRRYYEEFARDHGVDRTVQADLAEGWYRMGFVAALMGKKEEAMGNFSKALAMYRDLAQAHPEVVRYPYKQAMCLNDLGNVQADVGALDEATKSHQLALEIRQKIARENPTVAEYQKELAISYGNLGFLEFDRGRVHDALKLHEEERRLLEAIVRHHPDIADYRFRLAGSYQTIGTRQNEVGEVAEALRSQQRAIELLQRLVHEETTGSEFVSRIDFQSQLASSYTQIAFIQYRITDQFPAALESLRLALPILETLARENPAVERYRAQLAACLTEIGLVHELLGHVEEALKAHKQAIATREQLMHAQPSVVWFQNEVAYSNWYIGLLQRKAGREQEGKQSLHAARAIFEKLADSSSLDPYNLACIQAICGSLVGLGQTDLTSDEKALQKRYADRAMAMLKKATSGGYHNPEFIRKDPDFALLRERDDFKALIEQLRAGMATESKK
jgi:tetratricopeptide (TPR) repeat protein